MTQLRVYRRADVTFSDDDALALATLMTRINSEGDVVEYPPDFPLEKAQVVFNGADATISVEQRGSKNRRVCRLTEAKLTEPRKAGDPIIIEGTARELITAGFKEEDARIRATITKYASCATCR
jgi:hypothetical protein